MSALFHLFDLFFCFDFVPQSDITDRQTKSETQTVDVQKQEKTRKEDEERLERKKVSCKERRLHILKSVNRTTVS